MRLAVKGVAVRGINIGDVRAVQIPVPPFREQIEIVRRLSAAMDQIQKLLAEANRSIALLDRLDQATLAKAFRGELGSEAEHAEALASIG